MRKPIIAGNWKMNLTASEAKDFAEAVKNNIPANDKVDSVIGSPALFLQELVEAAKGTDLKISAQNCYWEMLEHSLVKLHLQLQRILVWTM